MKTILVAAVVSLLVSILCTPLVVKFFRRNGFGQEIREDGPQSHLAKRGTPTMGGVAIIGATITGYIAAHIVIAIQRNQGPTMTGMLLLFLMVGLGFVGFLDDLIKLRRQRNLGLRARAKFFGQLIVAVVFGAIAISYHDDLGITVASPHISFVRDIPELSVGTLGFVVLAYLIVTATSNAVNLTDGLDGLAAGASAMVFGAFTLICFLQSRYVCGGNPVAGCYVVRDPVDAAIVASAAMGACFGFLWWNASPAQIFMGDTGSMALGGLMAGLAIVSRTELLLVILGGLFATITLSVVLQTGWFKFTRMRTGTGRRIFRMAPLHHHFELGGWEQVTVIVRFWIVAGIAVAFGAWAFSTPTSSPETDGAGVATRHGPGSPDPGASPETRCTDHADPCRRRGVEPGPQQAAGSGEVTLLQVLGATVRLGAAPADRRTRAARLRRADGGIHQHRRRAPDPG